MNSNDARPRQPLSLEVKRLIDAISSLVRDHLDLARAELRQDAKRYAIDAALGASALPFLLAALLLFDVALALALGSWLGLAWGFALIGALNLAAAATLAGIAAVRLRKHALPLPETTEELQRNRALVDQLRQEIRNERGPLPPPSIRTYPGDGEEEMTAS